MPFSLDADVALKEKDGKPLSPRTQKDYLARLNNLASAGFDDRASLKKNATKVIKHISDLYPGDSEADRVKKRNYLYAIFWALDTAYIKKTNKYHKYLQTINPRVNLATGEKWVPLKEFKKE
jgi:hypothetical protein